MATGLYEANQGTISFTISEDIIDVFNNTSYSLTIKVKEINSVLYSDSIDYQLPNNNESNLQSLDYTNNGSYTTDSITTYAGGTPLVVGFYLYKVTIFDNNRIKLGTCEGSASI
jgi:hypothetical protein